MKRKSFLGRVAVIALALTLATTSMMSGTLAKYAKEASVETYALIAKWAPKITDVPDSGTAKDLTVVGKINLADTIKDTDAAASLVGVTSTTSDSGKRIAPGTSGDYLFKVDVTGAEVPTIVTMKAVEATGYVFPEHLTVKIMDESVSGSPTTYGTLARQWNSAGQIYGNAFTSSSGTVKYSDIIGGGGATPIKFKSLRESASATQSKVFRLHWEWPLTQSDKESSGYDENDVIYGTGTGDGGTTNKQFGFNLVVHLEQQATSGGSYNVIP